MGTKSHTNTQIHIHVDTRIQDAQLERELRIRNVVFSFLWLFSPSFLLSSHVTVFTFSFYFLLRSFRFFFRFWFSSQCSLSICVSSCSPSIYILYSYIYIYVYGYLYLLTYLSPLSNQLRTPLSNHFYTKTASSSAKWRKPLLFTTFIVYLIVFPYYFEWLQSILFYKTKRKRKLWF